MHVVLDVWIQMRILSDIYISSIQEEKLLLYIPKFQI